MSTSAPGLEAPEPFALYGPLPSGVTVLEASAGTGKTYTIAALATRYVAEGVPLEELLLVTFTRIATGELRDRVRERMVTAERGLRAILGGMLPGADRLVDLLADGPQAAVEARHRNLARAVASFDGATIATTHGFCQEVLGGLGIAGDFESDVTFVEDLSELAEEVIDDLYIRRFSPGGAPGFDRAHAGRVARAAIDHPSVPILAQDAGLGAMRGRLAARAREEFEQRKRRLRVMTFDDLVIRLKEALQTDRSAAAAAQLRRRFRIVLVDEFQDTDPDQWAILRMAFGGSDTTLVLIADPKQAIYAFRGADVYAYLEAAQAAGVRRTLTVNWRSDGALVQALDALLGGLRLGHPLIVYRQVSAADGHEGTRLRDAPVPAPLRLRLLRRDHPELTVTAKAGFAQTDSARTLICEDLADEVVALLSSDAEIELRDGTGRTASVQPGHLAVLVRTNRQAEMVRAALDAREVPAVINGAGSVFATDAARDWLALLEALERPASSLRAHAVALSPFIGWSARDIVATEADPWAWEDVHRRLHDWGRVLRDRGVAALQQTITLAEGLPARVLAGHEGERRLTDLRHLGQLLHATMSVEHLGTTALTAWLRTQIAEAREAADEERSRRLESDAEAVQVLTIHRSKGLEFPVVYLPFMWEAGAREPKNEPVFFHDPAAGDAQRLDVGIDGPQWREHSQRYLQEQRGEDLRLAYVALTRARHQVVLWWAGAWGSGNGPLTRLLFSRGENGDVAPIGAKVPADAAVAARMATITEAAADCVSIEAVAPRRLAVNWSGEPAQRGELSAAAFTRGLDRDWRRTSYSDITAASHEKWVGSEPEDPLIDDEPQPSDADVPPDAGPGLAGARVAETATGRGPGSAPSPLAGMPAGAEVGTFVHRVLEATDFAAADLPTELTERVEEERRRRGVEVGDAAAVVAGLRAALEAPLGPVLSGRRLADVARGDRLDELGFELPLAGGDTPTGTTGPSRIAAVLRAHLAGDDPMAAYAERLDDAGLRDAVRGYLTGSLDLVIRVRGRATERFAVLDYKTNRLGDFDQPLTLADYHPDLVAAEMHRRHYSLQALLYLVALFRFLRWRVAGFDPDTQLAGVVYLFVRGCDGAETPYAGERPYGVFGWRPPPGLVAALSDALDGGGT